MQKTRTLTLVLAALAAVATVAMSLPSSATALNTEAPRANSRSQIPLGGRITAKPPMPGMPLSLWNELVGPTAPRWRPKGRVIADSGFRPNTDGVPFLNYGNSGAVFPNQLNNYLFKTSLGNVTNMGSKEMIGLFGAKKVCYGNVRSTGSCTLKLAAAQWMAGLNSASNGGHCFGIATTVAQIYDGLLSPQRLGARTTHKVRFVPQATKVMSQAFSTQALVSGRSYSAATALPLLIQAMLKKESRYTISIRDSSGSGHAITPLAIYDRGKGQYDIAVYDNNYPDRIRGVHANTRAKATSTYAGFTYQLFTIPGLPPVDMVGKIELTPVESLLPKGNFACPFCLNASKSTIMIAPAVTDIAIKVRVTSPTGDRIPGLKVKYPTNPWRPGSPQNFPTFIVPAGVPFKVTLDNSPNPAPLSTAVSVTNGEMDAQLASYSLPAGSVDSLSLTPTSGEIVFATTGGSDPVLQLTDETEINEYQAQVASIDVPPGGGFTASLNQSNEVFDFHPPIGDNVINLSVAQIGQVGDSVVLNTGAVDLSLPPNGSMRWNYGQWNLQAGSTLVELLNASGSVDQTSAITTTPQQQ